MAFSKYRPARALRNSAHFTLPCLRAARAKASASAYRVFAIFADASDPTRAAKNTKIVLSNSSGLFLPRLRASVAVDAG